MSNDFLNKIKSWISPIKHYAKAGGLVVLELIKVAILAGITIALVRYFLFKPFYVKGASMEPNFFEHEYLLIDELTYRMRAPQRGEVIVFKYPDDQKENFIKRIIGLPGERVKISNGQVMIYNESHPEGIIVQENYLPKDLATSGDQTTALGQDEFFVLGDNRGNSYDSRRFGAVPRNLIVGRAWVRGWPFNRVGTFSAPQFNF